MCALIIIGIGSWGLMGNSWGFDGSQLHPPLMSTWSKEQLGWVNSTVVSRTGTYSLDQACDNPNVIKITEGFPNGEYLLIENRQPCGFETDMPQGGLAIFHIDNNINHNIRGYPGQAGNSWPTNGKHYKVALLQADGNYNLEKNKNLGDADDVFHACGINSISPSGTSNGAIYPNTNAYQGGNIVDTGVTISNIGPANYTMTFDIIFSSSTGEVDPDELPPLGYLLRGDPPIFSKNRKYYLKFQLDGNLALYNSCTSKVLWSPNIDGASAYVTTMQEDGNFVIYANGASGGLIALFATNTYNNPGARLVVQNDGNLVIYNSSGFPIWSIW